MIITICDVCQKKIEEKQEKYSLMIRKSTESGCEDIVKKEDICVDCYKKIIRVISGENAVINIVPDEKLKKMSGLPKEEPKEEPKKKVKAKKEPDAPEKEDDDGNKKFDIGKCMALYNAGWKPKAIAEEMRTTPSKVSNEVWKYNKTMKEKVNVKS